MYSPFFGAGGVWDIADVCLVASDKSDVTVAISTRVFKSVQPAESWDKPNVSQMWLLEVKGKNNRWKVLYLLCGCVVLCCDAVMFAYVLCLYMCLLLLQQQQQQQAAVSNFCIEV